MHTPIFRPKPWLVNVHQKRAAVYGSAMCLEHYRGRVMGFVVVHARFYLAYTIFTLFLK